MQFNSIFAHVIQSERSRSKRTSKWVCAQQNYCRMTESNSTHLLLNWQMHSHFCDEYELVVDILVIKINYVGHLFSCVKNNEN